MSNLLFVVLIQTFGMFIMFVFGWTVRSVSENRKQAREQESYDRFIGGHWYVRNDN